jgi:hypothetical protein
LCVIVAGALLARRAACWVSWWSAPTDFKEAVKEATIRRRDGLDLVDCPAPLDVKEATIRRRERTISAWAIVLGHLGPKRNLRAFASLVRHARTVTSRCGG